MESETNDDQEHETWHVVEQRRMWCLTQAISVALNAQRIAPEQPMINIMLTAEEMCEFVETGVSRTAPVSREVQ